MTNSSIIIQEILRVATDCPSPARTQRSQSSTTPLTTPTTEARSLRGKLLLGERIEKHSANRHRGSYATKRGELVTEHDDAHGDEEHALERVGHRVGDWMDSVQAIEGHLAGRPTGSREAGARKVGKVCATWVTAGLALYKLYAVR